MLEGKYRHRFHIQPPEGWLNDPNGSCWFDGKYHIFFQYTPDSPTGEGGRYWGHYVSEDLAHFTYVDTPIVTDTEWDSDGVYSGTAYTGDGVLEAYYTGNVKYPGDYDYINEGRGHNVLRVDFKDGIHPGEKQLLLTNDDYPSDLSCHVRDPKVWKSGEAYYMLLGMRSRTSKGGLLLMKSPDRKKWSLAREYFPENDFGYMLECPDYFTVDGRQFVGFCPQGMRHESDRFQNTYESGYCELNGDIIGSASDEELSRQISIECFQEWDKGFDFYAPQTFTTPDGRQILIGWAGVPDAGYENAPAIAEGWQHSMTLPRELKAKNGKLYQLPVRELDTRHEKQITAPEGGAWDMTLEFDNVSDAELFRLNDDLIFSVKDGRLRLEFLNDTGDGRTVRHAESSPVKKIRLIFDRSLLEIFVNDGETVFTTRYYPEDPDDIILKSDNAKSLEGWTIV